jgi:TatD DNase family protein
VGLWVLGVNVIDSHCHIAGEEFAPDLPAVVERARAAGLAYAMVVLEADDAGELQQAKVVASLWNTVCFAIGVHPHSAGHYASDPAAAARVAGEALDAQPAARAVGEIGLDYHYDFAPREVQQQVFREQIRLARRRDLPIVIHTREAEADTFRILEETRASEVGGVFHCFTGDRDMANHALAIGFHVSLAGIVSFPRSSELRQVAKMIPLDRLLIETDSPYLAPLPYRGKRNEPSYVVRVAETIAEARGTTPQVVGEAVLENFCRLFKP